MMLYPEGLRVIVRGMPHTNVAIQNLLFERGYGWANGAPNRINRHVTGLYIKPTGVLLLSTHNNPPNVPGYTTVTPNFFIRDMENIPAKVRQEQGGALEWEVEPENKEAKDRYVDEDII